jgi:hypothetical protein
MSTKGSRRLEREWGAQNDTRGTPDVSFEPSPPRRWSSVTIRENAPTNWHHRAKSDELRTLISIGLRKGLFVREHDTNAGAPTYTVSEYNPVRDVPRKHYLEREPYLVALKFMEAFS